MSDKLIKMTKIEQKPSRDLTEMNKLEAYLKEKGFKYERMDSDNTIPQEQFEAMQKALGYEVEPLDMHQIIVFENGGRVWDVVCNKGTYGADQGLLEGMGTLFGPDVEGWRPDVEGWLTAEDVIKKIEEADHETD